MNLNNLPQCPNCGATVVKVKDKEYYGCPFWRPGGQGCEGTIWYIPGQRKNNYPIPVISYKVESRSNPGHWHIVKVYESGDMDCPCVAGRQSKFCRHKQETVEALRKILKKIIEVNKLSNG